MDVAASNLRVRSNPEDGDVVDNIARGATVKVVECRGAWGLLQRSTEAHPEQWVHSDYLEASQSGPLAAYRNIRSFCERKWATDYEMQAYCVSKQTESNRNVGALNKSFDEQSEERRIVARCFERWSVASGGADWQMVEYCTNNQIKAYKALN